MSNNRMVAVFSLIAVAAIPAFALAQAAPTNSQPEVVVAVAGDIAGPWSGDSVTGDIIRADATIDRVLTVGDNVYPSGSSSQYAQFYEEAWGDFKDKTLPVPGNHDWESGAAGYREYFGKPTHYITDLGSWRLIALDSERCDSSTFLTEAIAGAGSRHILAYWHHPLLNVGTEHGNEIKDCVREWVTMLEDAGAELVVAGHDHSYQRFAPVNGVRHFVAGAGGKLGDGVADGDPDGAHLEKAIADELGVLRLELNSDSYAWSFVTPSGVQDSGSQAIDGEATTEPSPTPEETSTPAPETSPDDSATPEVPSPEETPAPEDVSEVPSPNETEVPEPGPGETVPDGDLCYIFSTYVVEHPDGTSDVIESPRQAVPCAALGSTLDSDAAAAPLPSAPPLEETVAPCEPDLEREDAGDASLSSAEQSEGCGDVAAASETSSQRLSQGPETEDDGG